METQTPTRLGDLTHSQVKHWRSLDYVRWISCLEKSDGREGSAKQIFEIRYPRSPNLDFVLNTKAAVAAGTTTDTGWAAPLAVAKPLTDAFLEYVRPQTLLGKIQNLRKVPFNVSIPSQTGGGTYSWVGQANAKPGTELDLATVTVGIAKAAGIITVTKELIALSQPGSDVLLRDDMAAGLAAFTDAQFVDPAVAEVVDVNPASITNGATTFASSGTSAANAVTDFKKLNADFTAANPDVEFAVVLMSPRNAVAMASAYNTQTFGQSGGTLFGIPVVTSTALGTNVVMLDARGILYADDGGLEITVSKSATVQMDSAPANPTLSTTVLVSYFQRGLVGLRAERWVNWKRARTSAVLYYTGAAYV